MGRRFDPCSAYHSKSPQFIEGFLIFWLSIVRKFSQIIAYLPFSCAQEFIWIEFSESYKAEVFRRGINAPFGRVFWVKCVKRFVLDTDKLPHAISARIGEGVTVRPSIITAAVIIYCETTAANTHACKRITKNAPKFLQSTTRSLRAASRRSPPASRTKINTDRSPAPSSQAPFSSTGSLTTRT